MLVVALCILRHCRCRCRVVVGKCFVACFVYGVSLPCRRIKFLCASSQVRCWLEIWSAFELALGCIYRQHGTPIARDAAVESLHDEFVVGVTLAGPRQYGPLLSHGRRKRSHRSEAWMNKLRAGHALER